MSNLTLNMALARKSATKGPAQPDSPMADSPMTPVTPMSGPNQQPLKEHDGDEAIPVFTHTISAIFVPLKQDLLAPLEPAKDRAEHLQRMQKKLNANEEAVRNNLEWMFEREARRRVAEARKMHDFSKPHQPEIIGWTEADNLIGSMSAPPDPTRTYHVRPEKLAEWNERIAPVAPGVLPPHEQTAREVLEVANNGSKEIEDYSLRHIKPIRERINASLKKDDVV